MTNLSVAQSLPKVADSGGAYKVLRRNGSVVDFEPSKIAIAVTKAFIATEGGAAGDSSRVRDLVQKLTAQVVQTVKRRLPDGGLLHIEHIQDQVELELMRAGEYEVARNYILYREQRAKSRQAAQAEQGTPVTAPPIHVLTEDGRAIPL